MHKGDISEAEREFKRWGLKPSELDKKIAKEIQDFFRRKKKKR